MDLLAKCAPLYNARHHGHGENVGTSPPSRAQRATDYIVKIGDYLFTIPLVWKESHRRQDQTRKRGAEPQARKALQDVCDKNKQLEESLKKVEELAATTP